jgi:hypothetical protein
MDTLQWSKAIVLRLSPCRSLPGPGTDQPEILYLTESLTNFTMRGFGAQEGDSD